MKPRILLAADVQGWAFDHIAAKLIKGLAHKYDFTLQYYTKPAEPTTTDVLVVFWWKSGHELLKRIRAKRTILCVYGGYSWANHRRDEWVSTGPQEWAKACAEADLIAAANDTIVREIPRHGLPICYIEDGVDVDMFRPSPLPKIFTIGWNGNSKHCPYLNPPPGDVDLKGVKLIKEACRLTKTPLVLADRVAKWTPFEEMPAWYSKISACICASQTEGTPNILLEAMAAGRPVITTDVGIVNRLVIDGCNGIITKRSIESIAEAITCLSNRLDIDKMALAARTAAEAHSWDHKLPYWDACLQAALALEPKTKKITSTVTKPRLDDVTVFVVTTGEPSTRECIEKLENQSHSFKIKILENIAPMNMAFQAMIDRCDTKYYVQVDADMMLDSRAISELYRNIKIREPGATEDPAMYAGWLWGDAEEMPIIGVKIYRHEVLRDFPYRKDKFSCEVPQIQDLKSAGHYTMNDWPGPEDRKGCIGLHFSMQTPEMAFRRWRRLVQKHRKSTCLEWVKDYPLIFQKRWLANPTLMNQTLYLGAMTGLLDNLPPETEVDFRNQPDDFDKLMCADLDREPTDLIPKIVPTPVPTPRQPPIPIQHKPGIWPLHKTNLRVRRR
jgi:glycosyltransferase involved in cell wall biosynthesis